MTDDALKAALYLKAVLPVLPALAAHDAPLSAALAGPDVAVALTAPDDLCARLEITGGRATVSATPRPGDVRLWFPSHAQLIRAFDGSGRASVALPVGGWFRLLRARRLQAAARRLEALLDTRAPAHLALHAWGNLLAGIHATTTWLRRHPEGPATRNRLGPGVFVFACPDFPSPLWIDTGTLATGIGEPSAPAKARVTFADIPTVLAELDHQLDAPAALGLGTLRLEGHVPFAENVSVIMLKAGNLLKPPVRP
jgi:hypothetical protein